MRHEQPGAEDGLRQDVQNGVGDDLAIDRHTAGTITNGPDADPSRSAGGSSSEQAREKQPGEGDLHGVGGPDDQGEETQRRVEVRSITVTRGSIASARHGEEVDDDQVGHTSYSIVG